MKKFLVLLLACIMAFGTTALAGCTEAAPPQNGEESGQPEQPQNPSEPDTPADESEKEKIKVYLIAGQSNALGCTATERLDSELTGVRNDVLFYANGEGAQQSYDNHAAHNRWTHVSPGFGVNGGSFGLEIGMSDILSQFYPAAEDGTEQVAVIKYTWGGTGLAKRWLTASGYPTYANTYEEGGRYVGYHGNTVGDLYAEFLSTVETATDQLTEMGYEPEFAGLAWMQGCDDASGEKNGKNYEAMLRCFVSDVRKDLNVADLPIAIGQINVEICPFGDTVREAQYKVAHDTENCSWIYTRDLNMKADDWWHFDSPDMYEMGKRFASALVLMAEEVRISEIRETVYNVSAGMRLYTDSPVEITLPAYAEAVTAEGRELYVPLTYTKSVPETAPSQTQTIEASFGEKTASVMLAVQSDPIADGRLDESVWQTVRAVPIGDKGSVIRVLTGEKGVYLAAQIYDTSIMNQWYDGSAWDPYLEDDQVKFYLYTGERTQGAPDADSYAIYLTASNVLRVYRGVETFGWDAINHYGRYEEGYYRKYEHRVRIEGTPFNATDDVDIGYSLEIFIPYECLGMPEEVKANLKINCAYEDKRDYEIPHTTYQLNGGVNEYDDLGIYLPYTFFKAA